MLAFVAGTAADVEAAHDPMIQLARLIDPESRRLRKIMETQEEVKKQAYGKIAAARFALLSEEGKMKNFSGIAWYGPWPLTTSSAELET